MSAVTFETLKFAKRLENAGMKQAEAEAFAEAQSEAFEGLTKTNRVSNKIRLKRA